VRLEQQELMCERVIKLMMMMVMMMMITHVTVMLFVVLVD